MYTDFINDIRCIFYIDKKYSKVRICSVGYKTYSIDGINLAEGVIVVVTWSTLQSECIVSS